MPGGNTEKNTDPQFIPPKGWEFATSHELSRWCVGNIQCFFFLNWFVLLTSTLVATWGPVFYLQILLAAMRGLNLEDKAPCWEDPAMAYAPTMYLLSTQHWLLFSDPAQQNAASATFYGRMKSTVFQIFRDNYIGNGLVLVSVGAEGEGAISVHRERLEHLCATYRSVSPLALPLPSWVQFATSVCCNTRHNKQLVGIQVEFLPATQHQTLRSPVSGRSPFSSRANYDAKSRRQRHIVPPRIKQSTTSICLENDGRKRSMGHSTSKSPEMVTFETSTLWFCTFLECFSSNLVIGFVQCLANSVILRKLYPRDTKDLNVENKIKGIHKTQKMSYECKQTCRLSLPGKFKLNSRMKETINVQFDVIEGGTENDLEKLNGVPHFHE